MTGSQPLLVVGRFVLGGGVGIISNCVPLYLSELPPANIRGAVVSTWQLTLAIGQVIGAVIAQGTKDVETTFSWRFPIGKPNFLFVPGKKHVLSRILCSLQCPHHRRHPRRIILRS